MRAWRILTVVSITASIPATPQAVPDLNPKISAIVEGVSQERIERTLKRLESFGTRHVLSSDTDPEHGIGAARRWLFEEFRSYSPRLQVRFDTYNVKKRVRIVRDTPITNVVAVLPGTLHPDHQILVTAHYDSLTIVRKPAAAAKGGQEDGSAADEASATATADWEKSAAAPLAPGVTDDASGVAAVLELARVMSQHEFDNTLVFIAFAGEEEGLIGSTLYAAKAKTEAQRIDAVLNNDIIGSDVAGDGRRENRVVNLYSADPGDSPSRTLARYIKDAGEKYLPAMKVNPIFREDRFARGGDHSPFVQAGYAAVRFTTPVENFANQHSVTDTFQNTSPAYTTSVAKVNAAAAASLAWAPTPPVILRTITTGERKGSQVPRISRGKSGYDAVLRWAASTESADLAGYVVLIRSTLAPLWEKRMFIGNVLEYTFPHVSIDEVVFGVQAIDKRGNASLVAPYVMIPRRIEKIETY